MTRAQPSFELDPVTAEPLRQRTSRELHAFLRSRAQAGPGSRAALRVRLGVPDLVAARDPVVEPLGQDEQASYERFTLPLEGGLTVDGLVVVPRGAAAPAPLVVAQHGGLGSPELATFMGGANYHGLVREAVAAGYVVWAPRLYMPAAEDAVERPALDRLARASGTTLIGVELGKLEAALTAVLHDDRVDRDRVAMVGLSIGGQYTLLATALDERIRVAVASNPVVHDGWLDELAPLQELVELICPRPLQVQVGTLDEVVPPTVARAVAPHAAGTYADAGVPHLFRHEEAEVGHDFVDALAWPFVAEHLR